MLKRQPLDADEASAAHRGNERGLTGGRFDQVIGRRARGQADLNGLSRRLHPVARIGRAADLLHDRSAPTPGRQAVLRLGGNGEVGGRRQTRRRQFALLLHRLQRLAVDEHQSTPSQKRPHVNHARIEPRPAAHDAGEGEGLVGIGKHRGREFVSPSGHRRRRPALASRPSTRRNGLLHPAVLQHLGAFDEHLGSGSGFVADHLRRARPAAGRAHALTIDARGDHHALARTQQLGGLVDGAEGARLRTRTVVVGPRIAVVHIVGLRERQRLFPCGVWRAVGKARVTRRVVMQATAEDAAADAGDRAHDCNGLKKLPAIHFRPTSVLTL